MHSAKTLPTRTCSTTPSSFNSIAATFGFSHHTGTDKNLELQVLKSILRRESALTQLHDTCHPKFNKIFLQNESGTGVLDQLTSIRDLTVNLIEIVSSWRQSQVNADPEIPRPFMYENQNYLLKVMFDMDFLADITPLVEALGLDAEKLRNNPLMMPESLDRANLGKDIQERASEDANGETSGSLFDERLRLRLVEQVLLREMDFNRKGAPSVAWGEDEKTDVGAGDSTFQSNTLASASVDTDGNSKARQADILGWYRQAQLQLIKLEDGIGEKLSANFNSTYRLKIPVPEDEPLVKMSFSPSKLIPPTTLYEHASVVAEHPLPGPRSRSPSPTRQGSGIRKLRRLPSQQDQPTIATLSPNLEWTRDDIQLLLELEQAPRCVALACASTLILLASGPQIPKNISWETFCLHANEAPIEQDMNAICPGQIPQFKIRAITPFLGSLTETFEEDLNSEDPEMQLTAGEPRTEAIRKLVTWIMEVLNVATSSTDQQGQAPITRMNSSQSTIDTIKSRRLESNLSLKKKQGIERARCPDDMKVKHSETVENDLLPDSTITISLEVQKKKSSNPAMKRFIIKVFDENTYQFAQVPVNCKEYTTYMYDLAEVFPGEDVELYFEPGSSKWWAKYIKEVVTVSNQGSLGVRISKKAIRGIVAKQIKAKDDEVDGDLVSQDDEMASQPSLKKEKNPEKKKKKMTTKARKEEAAAAAAKAKELEAKKKKEEADAKKAAAARARKEKEEAAAQQKKEEEDAAAKKKADEEREAEAAAAKKKAEEEEAAATKKAAEEKEAAAKKEEADDGYDDEYDAEYDDENFVMTPTGGSPNKQKSETEQTKVEEKTNENENGDDDGDDYGDDYDDDNYDDESSAKSLKKSEGEKVAPPPPATDKDKDAGGDDDDYAMSDDGYDDEFEEEE